MIDRILTLLPATGNYPTVSFRCYADFPRRYVGSQAFFLVLSGSANGVSLVRKVTVHFENPHALLSDRRQSPTGPLEIIGIQSN